MSVTIATAEDCASNYGTFEIQGSKGDTYQVTFSGSEGPAHCTCPGFKYRGDCKHIAEVYGGACLYNPQWHDGNSEPEFRPVQIHNQQFGPSTCKCGGPMVLVRRAF
jgi:hypothetical protein